MANVIVIGNGPAGISAALYTVRAGLKTTVIGKDNGSLARADKIENYYGFASPVSGIKLIADGIEQAKRLGITVLSDEVVNIEYDGKFIVKTQNSEHEADSVILATGSSRATPKIEGLREFEGHGVSYCAVCDAFFYRGKDVAVLGDGVYAIHEAMELLPVVRSVVLLTNGTTPTAKIPDGLTVNQKEIKAFSGDDVLGKVNFKDDTTIDISGVFVAVGVAGSIDLARKLGAEIDGTKIVVDENMGTNIPGLYAAGDCTGGLLQIAKAVSDGAKAGTAVIKYVRNNH